MKDKFITIGISSRVPIEYQILIWRLYDNMPTPKDYLQVFNLYTKAESQIIHHYAEQPKYEQTLVLLTDSPITEKIYVIDDGEHITMLLANEY